MCGIVGFAGASLKVNDLVLETLLILDSLRGTDSTGIAAIKPDGEATVVKQVGNPFELIGMRSFNSAMSQLSRCVIGHNRFATQGGVNKATAHPFDFNTLVGVHNGTLTNKHQLIDASYFKVDSENLYHHMEVKGLRDTVDTMKGAYSLVWWDKLGHTLNFLRNKERPMYVTYAKDGKSFYFASEKWMLEVALSRHGVAHVEICETKIHTHYSMTIDANRNLGDLEETEMAPPIDIPYVYNKPAISWVAGKKEVLPDRVPLYTGSTAQLEVLSTAVDLFGARYYSCFDEINPTYTIRLYMSKGETGALVDKVIKGTIASVKYNEGNTQYYKVVHSSVEIVVSQKTFTNAKGDQVSEEVWNQEHGTCDYCTGYVDPKQAFRFTPLGATICHVCAEHPSVQQFIQMV